MTYMARPGLTASALALAAGLLLAGVVGAQEEPSPSATAGVIIGMVARCATGLEQPAAQVAVGVDGGSGTLARTDAAGQFAIALPPGQYTVVATAADGNATRPYVPVEAGAALDIGVLDIGGGVAGCGPDLETEAPALPTVTPTGVPDAPTATPVPQATPQPTATPQTPDEPDPTAG